MKTYTIKEVSELFSMSASTLRYYEDIGILTEVERTKNNQRVYRTCHINRLGTICCFKGTGMTIAGLQEFFSYEDEEDSHIEDILTLLTTQKEDVDRQLLQLQKDREHVERKLKFYTAIKSAKDNGLPRPRWDEFKA